MEEEKIQVTPEQAIIMEEFSTLVRKILTQAEASFADKVQRESFKRIVENQVYEARNSILRKMAMQAGHPETPEMRGMQTGNYGMQTVPLVDRVLGPAPADEPEIPRVKPSRGPEPEEPTPAPRKDVTRRIAPLGI